MSMSKQEFEDFLIEEGWSKNMLCADYAYLQNYSEYIWDYIYINGDEEVKYIFNDSEEEETFKTYEDFINYYKNRW